MAGEFSRQKVHRIGEVVAEGDGDQVVVTTRADLFDVKRALSKDGSAQLVDSMTAENLESLTEKRYSSRFGTSSGHLDPAEVGSTSSPGVLEAQKLEAQKHKLAPAPRTRNPQHTPEPKTRPNRPSPNEMRKRLLDDDKD